MGVAHTVVFGLAFSWLLKLPAGSPYWGNSIHLSEAFAKGFRSVAMSDATNIDFVLQTKKGAKFLCFTLF